MILKYNIYYCEFKELIMFYLISKFCNINRSNLKELCTLYTKFYIIYVVYFAQINTIKK
jgi:hypothetical protein